MPTPTPAADGAHDRSPRAPRPTHPDPSVPPTVPPGPGALLGGRRVRLLPAILALALGSFAIGTTEFAMMGLLPQAVADLGIGLEAGGVLSQPELAVLMAYTKIVLAEELLASDVDAVAIFTQPSYSAHAASISTWDSLIGGIAPIESIAEMNEKARPAR